MYVYVCVCVCVCISRDDGECVSTANSFLLNLKIYHFAVCFHCTAEESPGSELAYGGAETDVNDKKLIEIKCYPSMSQGEINVAVGVIM